MVIDMRDSWKNITVFGRKFRVVTVKLYPNEDPRENMALTYFKRIMR